MREQDELRLCRRELERARRRCKALEGLYELARSLLQTPDPDSVLDFLMRGALQALGAERGFVVLARGDELEFKVVRNWSRDEPQPDKEPLSRSILAEVLHNGTPLLVEDALSDPRFSGQASVQTLEIRSVLAAPLRSAERVAGALYLESSDPGKLFGPEHLELFERMLELASRALEAATSRLLLAQRTSFLEKDLLARHRFPGLVTRDLEFLRLLETLAQVAPSDLPVLLQGPSGSGKELLARALHLNSRQSRGPFVVVNCGAISAQLLESELFGHVKGAFTGAAADKEGLLPQAHGGTAFLDELGELPLELQAKLLRVLQFGEVQPVGSARTRVVDVRFVAATNRDLERAVAEGRFREDLYYRLNAVTLQLPPLKDRPDDILLLFHHVLRDAAEKAGRPVPELGPGLERALQSYAWPGNVRELENEARRLLALTPPGLPLSTERLSRRIFTAVADQIDPVLAAGREKERIELHLRLAGGNRTHAARSLGISRETLRKKMKRHGIQ
jgi:Nif-specific regulatory protein/two-component system response regulator HydG